MWHRGLRRLVARYRPGAAHRARHVRRNYPPGAGWQRLFRSTGSRARNAPPGDHRRRRGAAADRQRRWLHPGGLQRRDLQPPRATRRAARPRPSVPDPVRHGDDRPSLRRAWRRLRRALARDVRHRLVGRAAEAVGARPGPRGHQATELLGDARRDRVLLRAPLAAHTPPLSAPAGSTGDRRLPQPGLRPGPAQRVCGRRQTAAGPRPDVVGRPWRCCAALLDPGQRRARP